jgi:hypothetical protein
VCNLQIRNQKKEMPYRILPNTISKLRKPLPLCNRGCLVRRSHAEYQKFLPPGTIICFKESRLNADLLHTHSYVRTSGQTLIVAFCTAFSRLPSNLRPSAFLPTLLHNVRTTSRLRETQRREEEAWAHPHRWLNGYRD